MILEILKQLLKPPKKKDAHTQVAISYTLGDVFTTDYYVDYAKRIESAGADSICIKDMAACLLLMKLKSLLKL